MSLERNVVDKLKWTKPRVLTVNPRFREPSSPTICLSPYG
jgi:hypothetical protein